MGHDGGENRGGLLRQGQRRRRARRARARGLGRRHRHMGVKGGERTCWGTTRARFPPTPSGCLEHQRRRWQLEVWVQRSLGTRQHLGHGRHAADTPAADRVRVLVVAALAKSGVPPARDHVGAHLSKMQPVEDLDEARPLLVKDLPDAGGCRLARREGLVLDKKGSGLVEILDRLHFAEMGTDMIPCGWHATLGKCRDHEDPNAICRRCVSGVAAMPKVLSRAKAALHPDLAYVYM